MWKIRKLLGKRALFPIVFISYPKSGRTWMRFIFNLVEFKVRFTHAGHETSMNTFVIKEFESLDKTVWGKRNIFMYRNPLDTAVSLFFQIHKRDFVYEDPDYDKKYRYLSDRNLLPPKDINEFVLHPVWGCENVCKFNRDWYNYTISRDDCFIIRYEDVRSNPGHYISEMLTFIGAKNFQIDEIVEKSSFENMKSLEMKGENKKLRLHGLKNNDYQAMKVRSGLVGGYNNYLTAHTIDHARRISRHYGFEV